MKKISTMTQSAVREQKEAFAKAYCEAAPYADFMLPRVLAGLEEATEEYRGARNAFKGWCLSHNINPNW